MVSDVCVFNMHIVRFFL